MVQTDSVKILKARAFAKQKHGDTLDDEGKNYFEAHVMQVGELVMHVTDDIDVICAAYLHDTIEDTNTSYSEIYEAFGKRVADLVMSLTHAGTKDNYGYYFPNLKSRDAILIKFADRLSNISRMSAWHEDRRNHYLKTSRFWKDGSDLNE